ncbi:gene transfer agent family protein [Sulfitobacter sp.]|uniref:gene transfer agent family protein n=1 Tax=Sulfitobacter sp. TaxID=1903071 RepID=UPI003298FE84
MGNRWRGEVMLVVEGQHHRMRLTLGALAELEEDLGETSLMALVQRFETGGFSTRDVLALLVAGLRGGGTMMDPDQLAGAEIEGGPMRAAQAAAELLARAFTVSS